MAREFIAEVIRDVFREILGDGEPVSRVVRDLVMELVPAHPEGPGEDADGVGEMLLDDDIRGVTIEYPAAQGVDAAALFFRAEVFPTRLGAGLLIGEAEAGLGRVHQDFFVHEQRRDRDAFCQRLFTAIDDHAADRRQPLGPGSIARALLVMFGSHQLDLDQPP